MANEKLLKATIVSLIPYPVVEKKPGMIPPEFLIPKAAKNDFEILPIGLCQVYIYLDHDRGSVAFTEFANTVAESIVKDYVSAQYEYRGEDCQPGLFWLPGELTKADILKNHKDRLDKARRGQNNWFTQLVKAADDSWNRVKRHSEISDIQRLAVKQLGLTREWLIDYSGADYGITEETVKA